MDRDEFVQKLQNSLLRLYDYSYLASHPLFGPTSPLASASAQNGAIVEAIEEMKPAVELPDWSPPNRTYQYLLQRYVQLRSVKEISRSLGVSERQSQRINAEAIEGLAEKLRSRWEATSTDAGQREGTRTDRAKEEGSGANRLAEREAALLAGTPGPRHVHLAEVMAGVMDTLSNMASSKDTRLCVDLPANLPPVAAERTLLRQGLLSLLLACLDAAADRIDIAGASTADGTLLQLRVSAREQAPAGSLFESVLSNRSLRMATQMLRAQRGEVDVRKEEDGGVTVIASFPSAQVPTILVVDDNPDTVRLYRRYLGSQAYHVVDANSGPRAVSLARKLHPAAITLDVMMPDQDGWETLQKLHNDPETHTIPVIICSVIDQRDLALSLGAFDLLAKPVSRSALLVTLDRCLEQQAAR